MTPQPGSHVRAGLRQAGRLLVLLGVGGLVAAVTWTTVAGGGLQRRWGVVLMVLAGLVGLTSGTELSRLATTEARALLGSGVDREQPSSGEALTTVGLLLLVALPLFVAGAVLAG